MKSRRLNAEQRSQGFTGVLLCGFRGLCVELRISEQVTERTEKTSGFLCGFCAFCVPIFFVLFVTFVVHSVFVTFVAMIVT